MKTKNIVCAVFLAMLFLIILMLSKCEMAPMPQYERQVEPTVTYTNNGMSVTVHYDRDYFLRCGNENPDVPFEYQFEDDCEINIRVNGREYDFDSPYDIELDDSMLESMGIGAALGYVIGKKTKKKKPTVKKSVVKMQVVKGQPATVKKTVTTTTTTTTTAAVNKTPTTTKKTYMPVKRKTTKPRQRSRRK